ncbi:NADH-quinone oxidoreductase subunit M [Rhodococcus maanshanensis]|uniref:NADH-quinone oxidoreductase subunit M n=1 Tax=Rhodococcus maanshanensis TaxID=183556 RepID=A0A1H7M0Q7_9NOCA|nr:NADH-quinone oxidoreductase subunit M [Rhodococcus maanshanensis]SEL04578.1 NADH-quinone oxidoreductase subunit M [Rhodococcus maanshanensis]
MSLPWLTAIWVAPLVGAGAVLALPADKHRLARSFALGTALVVLALAVSMAVGFDPAGEQYQYVESHAWIPAFGTRYTLGVDGIALVMVLLTAVLVPLLLLAGWNDVPEPDPIGRRRIHFYVALILVVESMVLVSFTALDILLFYVFFEAMLLPMYFLIGGFGNGHRTAPSRRSAPGAEPAERPDSAAAPAAAVKFLLYNLFGGLIMLAAVIGLYVVTVREGSPLPGGTFDFREIVAATSTGGLGVDPGVLNALFLGFMFAFAVKAPLWPFHTWLPGAATAATPATAVLMMAVVDKVGTFAMLRYCLQLFPESSAYFAPLIVTLAVVGIVYGALLAIGQTDVMRLIAYTSISHFGFIILGIFAMTSQGQAGSTLYMVNHGISTAALFLVAGFLVSRRGTRAIAAYGGVQKVAPLMAGTFLVAGLATLSLPGLAPFVSEFLVLVGTFTRYPVAALIATSALVLAAIYVLWLYQRVMAGPVNEDNRRIRDLVPRELAVVAPLIALLLVLGFYPKPVLDIVNPAVSQIMTTIGQQDPAPTGPQLTGYVADQDNHGGAPR